MEWTPAATDEFDRYRERIKKAYALEESGADPEEVVEDIRLHLVEDLTAAGVQVVTRDHVRNALSRLGQPLEDLPEAQPPPPRAPRPEESAPRRGFFRRPAGPYRQGMLAKSFIMLFGVLLPLITILIEVSSGFCASEFFDPIPTVWHVLLISLVPLVNFALVLPSLSFLARHRTTFGILNGLALGISLFYSLVFLPLLPLAVVAILFMGLGLLPLAPALAVLATLANRAPLRFATPSGEPARAPGLAIGLLVSFLALSLVQLPTAITNMGLQMAASSEPGERQKGISLLRRWGEEEVMLRRCYDLPQMSVDLISIYFRLSDPVRPERVRPIYYQVTGHPFNAVPPPEAELRALWVEDPALSWRRFDQGQGGTEVAGRVNQLALVSSLMDGVVHPDAAQSYVEWTLVFQNDSSWSREARMLLHLPPDGVTSRVTLWVDGEEREASFAGRDETRQAYQDVVMQVRDPLLVTTAGPDEVLVQCFPVSPDGGRMKIRVGITAPIPLASLELAHVALPTIIERNFAIDPELSHSVWFESNRPFVGDDLTLENPETDLFIARGQLDDGRLHGGGAAIGVRRAPAATAVWSELRGEEERVVRASFSAEGRGVPARIVLVVDASLAMADALPRIADALELLPIGVELSLLVAGDEVQSLVPLGPVSEETYADAAAALRAIEPVGGCDNVPALERAWELCSGRADELIVWLHGTQPVLLRALEPLKQSLERRRPGPRMIELQLAPGPNRVARGLTEIDALARVPRLGSVEDDLARLFGELSGRGEEVAVVRERVPRASLSPDLARTSDHLARLWAHEEVHRLLKGSGDANRAEALALSVRHQLVTPVTGAVVLESREQHEAAGLTPVDSATVPTVPEPEMILLVAIVALLLGLAWMRSRRKALVA